jgi:PAS domain-containing protein
MTEFDPEARMIAGPQFDKIYCPSCNSPNPVGSKFCVHCSSYLDELEGDAPASSGGADALDSLLARQREETAEPEQVTPMPPDPGMEPPAPISSPGASVASASASPPAAAPPSAPPPSAAPPPDGDQDLLVEPIHLADGRVITRRSTLAKLEKLQQILGEAGPLTGATKGKSDEVLALEAKIAEQAQEIEKLTTEKEEIVQAYMADALDDENPEMAEAQAAVQEATLRASRAEAEAARLSRGEAEMHKEMRDKVTQIKDLEEEIRSLQARLMEQPDALGGPGGAGGADPQALAAAQERAQKLEAALQQVMGKGQGLQAQIQQLQEQLAAAQAGGGGGGAEAATLREQLTQVQTAAKDQVRVVTRYYERILGRVPCGVLVLAEGGVILSVNPALTSLLGIPAPELLRKPLVQVPVFQPLVPLAAALDQQPPDQDMPSQSIELATAVGPVSIEASAAQGELGNRQVKILVLDPGPGSGGGGGGVRDAQGLREDLFGLRMMIELLGNKADKPQVVADVTRDLLGDLDRIVSLLE